ncbi:condensation domain-containing protein, partial [Catenovulum sediminis]
MTPVVSLLQELNSLGIKLVSDDNQSLSIKGNKRVLTNELVGKIKELKGEIIALIYEHQNQATVSSLESILPVDPSCQNVPLSYAQQSLWLLDKIENFSHVYNMTGGLKLAGRLDFHAVQSAFFTIVQRHKSLRTCIQEGENAQAIQTVRTPDAFQVEFTDLSELAQIEQQDSSNRLIKAEARAQFNLTQDYLLRVHVVKLAQDEHLLWITLHHIASDGWSMSLLVKEFETLYQAYTNGQENPLAQLEIQYADYAYWQRTQWQGESYQQQLKYWQQQLVDLPELHNLPLAKSRPETQSFTGAQYNNLINENLSKQFKTLCEQNDATVFMGLHSVFSVLLARYSGQDDIVVGTPVANRANAQLSDLIGFFVNVLVLRCQLSCEENFLTLLAKNKSTLMEAYAHQQVPFEQVVERLQPNRNLNYSPLFQVLLVVDDSRQQTLSLPGLTVESIKPLETVAKYDLTLVVSEVANQLLLTWEFDTELFTAAFIENMAENFAQLLQSVITDPKRNLFDVQIVRASEQQRQLKTWNASQTAYAADKCIHELFEAQVAQAPQSIALYCEGQERY